MTDYDLVDYPSKPFPQCHPDRLALMARLFGLKPPPVETSRVLEIGCGDGLNLIASAVVLPGAAFHGVDISAAATRRGRRLIRETGLKNVRLETRDFRDLPPKTRKFDYVIAHGLYSWVPAEIRDALLAGIRSVLSPHGIAFVSYNTYPGAYLRQMVREMAAIAAGTDLAATRAWLESATNLPDAPAIYRAVVADEARDMLRREDGALFHDDLSATNQPVWFRDFAAHAAAHGLQYVAEADLAGTARVSQIPDRLQREQHADFHLGRRFRQTLLCHAAQSVADEPDPAALENAFAGAPVDPAIPHPDGAFEYVNRTGARIRTTDAGHRAILDSLAAAWPVYLPVSRFGRAACPRFADLFAAGILDLRTVAPPAPKRRPARPHASPLARSQTGSGAPLTTLHHLELFIASQSLQAVLALADGSRTRAQLLRDLRKLYPEECREAVAAALEQHLEELRLYGLLLA